ncbi:MAG: hypothetical protein FWB86_10480 [Treponema sp.]|nr:hypothetical protein [Treponema sp.]
MKTSIGKPAKWLIDAAATIDLDFSDLTHEKTNDFVTHTQNQHGNIETEKQRGQLPVTSKEIEQILEIIKNPDCVIIGLRKYGQILNVYLKRNTIGSVIYYEEILKGKKNKSLRSKTMYIKMGLISNETFIKVVSNNANTDLSNAKIVVGAGGNPGGEALK